MALGGVAAEGPLLAEDVEAVLLDGLGTLVALEPPWPALVERLREAHGMELAPAAAEQAFRAEIAYYRAHHHEGRDAQALADLRRRCAEVLRGALPAGARRAVSTPQLTAVMLEALRFAAYPDAPVALAGLRARGVSLVVVSNWDVSLSRVLREVGLEEAVDGVVTSAHVGSPKPKRAIFDAALALAGSRRTGRCTWGTRSRTTSTARSLRGSVRCCCAVKMPRPPTSRPWACQGSPRWWSCFRCSERRGG